MSEIAWIASLGATLYALHRLGLWLESRGWLYYTRKARKGRSSLAIAAAFDPYARKVLELEEKIQLEEDEGGDGRWPGPP